MNLRERCEKFKIETCAYTVPIDAIEAFAREIRNDALIEAGDVVRDRGPFFKTPEYMWIVSDEIAALKDVAKVATEELNMERPNLAALMDQVPQKVVNEAYEWALEEAKTWPHGTYSPYDFMIMYQKGYIAGYLKALAEQATEEE